MKKFLSLLVIILVLFLYGCASIAKDGLDSSPKESGSYSRDEYAPSGERYGYEVSDGGYMPDMPTGESDVLPKDEATNNETQLRAGQLTASVTMDNEKYEFWKSLLVPDQEGKALFQNYNKDYAFKTGNRIKLSFKKGTVATVKLLNSDNTEFVGTTDANGVCYVFAKEDKNSYNITVSYLDKDNNLVSFDDEVTGDKEYDLETLESTRDLIEIMFVIDATGSMGDEMNYLKVEITDVIRRVKEMNDNVRILLSVMVYRDKGDEYVTRYNDFTEDVESQISFLSKQYASGGGDFEEAVETALLEASQKQWTNSNSTKILVHVADAPAHDKDVEAWNAVTLALAAKGIRVLTVASSGIDKKTEYFFRAQSILTNGAYSYLTNDSGIGGSHIDATTEEKEEVELLNDLLVRVINGFHTGDYGTPVNWRQSQSGPQS